MGVIQNVRLKFACVLNVQGSCSRCHALGERERKESVCVCLREGEVEERVCLCAYVRVYVFA